eukprot:TRINITY_DN14680_c0_g1_i1.p1 TRINITY_DN14680_c0_g1~~TRINITY_DN14680_c0_g1_i1.p1  ORF type:complete len:526 (+),score=130.16 TRINITY_DN14680_c0_g1_i1:23-1579(+)
MPSSEPIMSLQRSKDLLAALPKEDEDIWKYFMLVLETPRPSHKEEKIRNVLRACAEAWGLSHRTDSAGNLVIAKPGTLGKESVPSVAIQCHMDMVCSKNDNIKHNWDEDAVNAYIDGDYLKAKGTTLGADDGIGIAACLAILSNNQLSHGPIECLFTADEEDEMSGAENIDGAPFLESKFMINVDSEEEYSICVGCAGGFEREIRFDIERESSLADDDVVLDVSLRGMLGGHTGIDADKGRGHGILLIVRVLRSALASVPFKLVALKGGTASNAIPREATATVSIPRESVATFRQYATAAVDTIKEEYQLVERRRIDDKWVQLIQFTAVEAANPLGDAPCTAESTKKVLDFASVLPNGVLRMSAEVEGLVETSISFSIAELKADHLFTYFFARSSSETQMDFVKDQLQSLCNITGATTVRTLAEFPGWQPQVEGNRMLDLVKTVHKEVMGKDGRVYAVHAGLECGFFQKAYPSLICVSIGPEILGAHSPDERILIPSVGRFFRLLVKTLESCTPDLAA